MAGAVTPVHKRKVMGRKGIGKLSLFSIANTVEIYTAKGGEKSALRMSVPAIKAALADEKVKLSQDAGAGDTKADLADTTDSTPTGYHPEPLDTGSIDFEHGTRIVLKDLKKGIARSGEALRTRLAEALQHPWREREVSTVRRRDRSHNRRSRLLSQTAVCVVLRR